LNHDSSGAIDPIASAVTVSLGDGTSITPTISGAVDFTGPPCPGQSCSVGVTFEIFADALDTHGVQFSGLTLAGSTPAAALALTPGPDGALHGILDAHEFVLTGRGSANANVVSICLPGSSVCWSATAGGTQAVQASLQPGAVQFAFDVDFVGHTFKMTSMKPFEFGGDAMVPPFTATWSIAGNMTNEPPKAVAPSNLTVECTSPTSAAVTLNGGASSDPEDNIANFVWWSGPVIVGDLVSRAEVFPTTVAFSEPGPTTTDFNLAVVDARGQIDSTPVSVTAVDTTPPSFVSVAANPSCLWPPNHKYVVFELGSGISVVANDVCDPAPHISIVDVRSDEPDNGLGDGDSGNDVVFDENRVCLRSERSGTGHGRTYTVTLAARDAQGNVASTSLAIIVPHDERMHGCPPLAPSSFVSDDDIRCAGIGRRSLTEPGAGTRTPSRLSHIEENSVAAHAGCSSVASDAALLWLTLLLMRRRRVGRTEETRPWLRS
jgi:hypothetical protein